MRRLETIRAKGDPLETIKKIVRWEDFRADTEAVTETKLEERQIGIDSIKVARKLWRHHA
jgi:hypothetical protein